MFKTIFNKLTMRSYYDAKYKAHYSKQYQYYLKKKKLKVQRVDELTLRNVSVNHSLFIVTGRLFCMENVFSNSALKRLIDKDD